MAEANPYSAPDADLGGASEIEYQPDIFTFKGRIGRMRYLAYSFGLSLLLMLLMIPIFTISTMMGDPTATNSVVGIIGMIIFYVVAILVSVMVAKRRLNDLNRSGWWFLIFLIPLVNLLLVIYLIFFPGTEGANDYGPPAVANTMGVLILAWLMPAMFILGIGAAILIPALAPSA